MQLKKLAVICNVCFWLTLFFQVWRDARNIHQHVLNTIVVLGMFAVVVNIAWIISILKKDKGRMKTGEPGVKPNIKAGLLFNSFNLLSFAAQLILLFTRYL